MNSHFEEDQKQEEKNFQDISLQQQQQTSFQGRNSSSNQLLKLKVGSLNNEEEDKRQIFKEKKDSQNQEQYQQVIQEAQNMENNEDFPLQLIEIEENDQNKDQKDKIAQDQNYQASDVIGDPISSQQNIFPQSDNLEQRESIQQNENENELIQRFQAGNQDQQEQIQNMEIVPVRDDQNILKLLKEIILPKSRTRVYYALILIFSFFSLIYMKISYSLFQFKAEHLSISSENGSNSLQPFQEEIKQKVESQQDLIEKIFFDVKPQEQESLMIQEQIVNTEPTYVFKTPKLQRKKRCYDLKDYIDICLDVKKLK